MNTNDISLISQLSDQQLLEQVKLLVQREREATAVLISHLAVLQDRGLYLAEGCSSMFTYCVQVLHLSEAAAYKRIEVARAVRKYPVILELLGDGSVNLTTVLLLAPRLTPENHVALLVAATHQKKRQVEELAATLRPLPPVPSSIRRLPPPKCAPVLAQNNRDSSPAVPDTPGTVLGALPGMLGMNDPSPLPAAGLPPVTPASPARRARIEPLAPQQYKIQFTARAETCEKLRLAWDLLRHQIPDGDLGEVMDRALTALLDRLVKQKLGATDRPRTTRDREPKGDGTGTGFGSRHIPAEVRRTVWKRDGGQCAFVAADGHRCTDRAFLEFHHVVPHAAGGPATVDNIQLRCRAHNGHEAERYFGRRLFRGRETAAISAVGAISTRSGASCSPAPVRGLSLTGVSAAKQAGSRSG